MNAINRLEARLATLTDAQGSRAEGHPIPAATNDVSPADFAQVPPQLNLTPHAASMSDLARPEDTEAYIWNHAGLRTLSFSGRRIMDWLFDTEVFASGSVLHSPLTQSEKQLHLEFGRPPFNQTIPAQEATSNADWVSSLNMTSIRVLSEAYFKTFARVYPIMDSEYYFEKVLGRVLQEGFGCNIQSCLVLAVLAVGSWGYRGMQEGGYLSPEQSKLAFGSGGTSQALLQEDPPGLSFFNNCRKRIGFVLSEQSVQVCQLCHLLAIYNAQLMRPLDDWSMTSFSCNIVQSLWPSVMASGSDYEIDIYKRIFWCTLSRETVLVDELQVPRSPLQDLEGQVGLPNFVEYATGRPGKQQDDQYHTHFLAQCALRLIMSRIRNELFRTDPSHMLVDELLHQLEQWRISLPSSIQAALNSDPATHTEAAQTAVVSLLQSRNRIATYHIGRPFLLKAVSKPAEMSNRDIEICKFALQEAMEWFRTSLPSLQMRSFMPLRFFVCGQYAFEMD